MRMSAFGIARAVLATAAGAALVGAATQSTAVVSAGPTEQAQAGRGSTTSTVRSSSLVCPGPEFTGVQGLADRQVPSYTAAATAPAQALGGLSLPKTPGKLSLTRMPSGNLVAPVTTRGTPAGAVASGPAVVSGTESLAAGLAATQQ